MLLIPIETNANNMLTDDQLHAVFEMYDCKRDGVITQEEMKQFLQKCLSDEAQVATEFKVGELVIGRNL